MLTLINVEIFIIGGVLMRTEKRYCAVCKSDDFVLAFEQKYKSIVGLGDVNYTQTIVICKKCGFTYNNPVPVMDELSKYYTMFSNYENPQRDGKESREMLNKWNRTYQLVEKAFPPNFAGKALEIGCATATGLSIFKAKGWDVLGIEPSLKACNLARKLYDIEVINGIFDSNALIDKKPFDLIILSHVVEHLTFPDQMIRDLKPLLKDNGLVYIEVPNMLRPFVPMGYFMFEHLNYFTPTTLSSLMAVNGFSAEIELFDNSAEIEPFYPVIVSIGKKKQESQDDVINDYAAAYAAIKDYKDTSGKEVAKLQSRIDTILESVSKGRLGIWGAGIHTSQLLSLTSLSNHDIACVFDNDTKKHGERINGIEIIALGQPEEVKKTVDAIIISSKASENEIYNQIKYLINYGVNIYKLYET